ncbi:MAG: DNA methyltransferase [Anaerolineaceae bacterium]|nr:DNA methyltransferase [Anaerolineaceae bacterium]
MTEPNWANRTIFTGDNLNVMRGMNSDCVDLIYLDPPFNSDADYEAPIGSPAEGTGFKDTWTMDDVKVEEHGEIADRNPALYQVIETTGVAHGKSMKAYAIMMGLRLMEMKRILKSTGSIYLHCDDNAAHYLKLVLDTIFGKQNFRNEITWKRTFAHNDPERYGRITDTIFFYSMSDEFTWNKQYMPYTQDYIDEYYTEEDERGRFQPITLTGAGASGGESGEPWRGCDPTESDRHWSVSRRVVTKLAGHKALNWPVRKRLDLLDDHSYIYWPAKGKVPRLKQYLDEMKGTLPQSLWTDIKRLSSKSPEYLKFKTQKPLALLDRIIRASSDEGDVILDPFCGCATACVAAEELKRQWVGIDVGPKAVDLVIQRFVGTDQLTLLANLVTHREDIPLRTDLGKLPNYRTHKHELFGLQEGLCEGCCHAFPFRNFTVDHIIAKSRGGTDHLDNLQLLCNACNSMKGTRSQAEFRAELKRIGITGSCWT